MRPRLTLFLTLFMLLALPAANAFAAPKSRVKFQTKVQAVQEDAGTAVVRVVRSKATNTTVSVNYATSSTTATAGGACGGGVDYQSASGTLSFGPTELTKDIVVPICDDTDIEGGEIINVTLAKVGTGVVTTGGSAQIVIADDDGAPRFAFAGSETLVFESPGTATLSVIRLGIATAPATVGYATAGGSATPGADYVEELAGVVSFPGSGTDPVGATVQTITVDLLQDGLNESDESFTVALSGASLGTPSVATVTIIDDDSPASIAFQSAALGVGEADGSLLVTLRRSGSPGSWVTADYTTVDGTALAGSDFETTSFTPADPANPDADALFDPGEIETTVAVPITDDSLFEGLETFGLGLSNVRSDGGVDSPGPRPETTVSITDNDPEPAGSAAPAAPAAPAPPPPPPSVGGVLDAGAGSCGVTVVAAKKQRVARRKTILVRVVSKRACTIRVRATLKYGKARSSAVRTKLVTRKLAAGQRAVVRLRLSKKAMKSVTKMLRAKRRVTAGVLVSSARPGGKSARRTVNVRLAR